MGFAAKGAWFEVEEPDETTGGNLRFDSNSRKWYKSYNIYKDPVTDDGAKKSLKGFQFVSLIEGEYVNESEVSETKAFSPENELKLIYENGVFYHQSTLGDIRERINSKL